jgi:uncharacterized membrane protein (TIGR02234 family)
VSGTTPRRPGGEAGAGRGRGGRGGHRAVAAALILVGAALVAFAATRIWWTADYPGTPVGTYRTSATGSDTLPELIPVALVALAGWGAALATKGIWRRVIGALVGVVGAVVAVRVALQWAHPPLDQLGRTPFVVGAAVDPVRHPWPMLLAAVGGLLILAGGVLVIVAAGSARLSARYDRFPVSGRPDPVGSPAVIGTAAAAAAESGSDGSDLWKALDAGLDPTLAEPVSERVRADDYHQPPSGTPEPEPGASGPHPSGPDPGPVDDIEGDHIR